MSPETAWGAPRVSAVEAVDDDAGKLTQFLFIGWADGTVKELEVHVKAGHQFQGPFVDEIVRRAAEAGATPPAVP